MNYINCDKCKYRDEKVGCSAEECYSLSNVYHKITGNIRLFFWAIQSRTKCNHLNSGCSFRVMKKYCSYCKGGCDNR